MKDNYSNQGKFKSLINKATFYKSKQENAKSDLSKNYYRDKLLKTNKKIYGILAVLELSKKGK